MSKVDSIKAQMVGFKLPCINMAWLTSFRLMDEEKK